MKRFDIGKNPSCIGIKHSCIALKRSEIGIKHSYIGKNLSDIGINQTYNVKVDLWHVMGICDGSTKKRDVILR